MKRMGWLAAAGLLAGCHFATPLFPAPVADADPSLVGRWTCVQGETTNVLLVLPLDAKEHLVAFGPPAAPLRYGRVCYGEAAGLPLAQMRCLGDGLGRPYRDPRLYALFSFAVTGGTLVVRPVNPEAVERGAKTPADLAAALDRARDLPNLFREPRTYARAAD
jgi:hypothetical protein